MAEKKIIRLNPSDCCCRLMLIGLVFLLAVGCGTYSAKQETQDISDAALSAPKTADTVSAKTETAAKLTAPGPEQLYQQALAAYRKRDFDNSMATFDQMINNHPDHRLIDNALYWTAECLYSKGDYQGAIDIFKSVADKYPDGNKAPDALLKIGYSYIALKDHLSAVYYFKKIVMDYPFAPVNEKAQDMLERFHIEGHHELD